MKATPVTSRKGTVAQVDEVDVNLRSMAAAPFVVKFAGHYKSVLGRRASQTGGVFFEIEIEDTTENREGF